MALSPVTYSQTPMGLGLLRSDGLFVPIDPNNRDYQAFLAWQSAGNAAVPYVPPAPDTATAIAESGRSLCLARARQKVAQSDLAGALELLIQYIERT